MATIQEVARLAGVSTATVSRVLNDSYTVSEKRKKQVLDAVRALDYRPNIIGRNLSRNENRTILVVSGAIDGAMLRGAHSAAKELGYDVILSYSEIGDRGDALKYFENGLAGGLLFINFFEPDEAVTGLCRKYPVVQCAEYVDIPEACFVSIHDREASYEITEMLIKQGRRRFSFFAPYKSKYRELHFAEERKAGFLQALSDYGIPYDPELTRYISVSLYDEAKEQAMLLAQLPPDKRPDAVVCAQDIFGIACVNTFRNMGIPVPGEIAVTGFDNRGLSRQSTPMLTTVSQPFFEMGAESARMLIAIMNKDPDVNRRVFLKHEIIIRGSTQLTVDN
ncbi:MAG: LacI family transcriptional regulator [Oscillospiraceae bacterium]|jgi:LacI family repressor for deo operon, udp, cdd, tsx, nupC, and nupG|nr:LacI family transcriptional regulator [Oscillospiraceae bacterium]